MDRVSQIARAVLYEGYLLWPYRPSARKNRQRWTFGAVFPPAWTRLHPDDPNVLQAQVLVEGPPGAEIAITLRFLHVVEVQGEPPWEEAVERELVLAGDASHLAIAGDEAQGRRWHEIEGILSARSEPLGTRLRRLTVRFENRTKWAGADRAEALRHATVSTHLALRTDDAGFVSLVDPPAEVAAAAQRCVNVGTWPVLVGEPGDHSQMLCAPIILGDHPQIAPESPGDLFDGGEIDQLLILNVLALTDAEKREMRDCDPRAAEILDRCSALGRDELMRLHGAIRELRPL